jgi:hypothetical protein
MNKKVTFKRDGSICVTGGTQIGTWSKRESFYIAVFTIGEYEGRETAYGMEQLRGKVSEHVLYSDSEFYQHHEEFTVMLTAIASRLKNLMEEKCDDSAIQMLIYMLFPKGNKVEEEPIDYDRMSLMLMDRFTSYAKKRFSEQDMQTMRDVYSGIIDKVSTNKN